MWWFDTPRLARLAAVFALAGLTAGCFQPLYGDRATVGGSGIGEKLSGVDVAPIDAPNGSHLARVGVGLRNELIFDLTGGGNPAPITHKLTVRLTSKSTQVIVDVNTARADIQSYGIDAIYTLTSLATGKVVMKGQTFSRVSFDVPGQEQRFAGARGLRDAENRATKVISDNIRSRLASFFVAGT